MDNTSQPNQDSEMTSDVDIPSIILELIEKYGLTETDDDFFRKLESNEQSIEGIIADTIRDLIDKKISLIDMSQMFRRKLELSENKAEELIKDIKEEILPHIEITSSDNKEFIFSEKETKTPNLNKPKISNQESLEKERKQDTYREPIEKE